jgi:hypothetical protein
MAPFMSAEQAGIGPLEDYESDSDSARTHTTRLVLPTRRCRGTTVDADEPTIGRIATGVATVNGLLAIPAVVQVPL